MSTLADDRVRRSGAIGWCTSIDEKCSLLSPGSLLALARTGRLIEALDTCMPPSVFCFVGDDGDRGTATVVDDADALVVLFRHVATARS